MLCPSAGNEEPVVLHQDLHGGNVLRAEREPWLAIDPNPLVGERDVEARASVVKSESHYLTVSNPSVISMFVPQGSLMNAIAMPSAGTLV